MFYHLEGIVPGSQHWESYPATAEQQQEYGANEAVAVMEAGDYFVFNPACQHRGRANAAVARFRSGSCAVGAGVRVAVVNRPMVVLVTVAVFAVSSPMVARIGSRVMAW